MGSLRKKARQKPLTERAENPLGQPPYVNQGVLASGKLQEGMVMGRTGGKTTASNHRYLDQPRTPKPWVRRGPCTQNRTSLLADEQISRGVRLCHGKA